MIRFVSANMSAPSYCHGMSVVSHASQHSGVGYGAVSIIGTVSSLNTAIASLAYVAPTGHFGSVSLSLAVTDEPSTGPHDALSSTSMAHITIAPSPHAPLLTLHHGSHATKNATISLGSLILNVEQPLNDTDVLTITITAESYFITSFPFPVLIITLSTTTALTNDMNTNNTSVLQISGMAGDILSAVRSAQLSLYPGFFGTVRLHVSVNNTQGLSATETVTVTVDILNEPPYLVLYSTSGIEDVDMPFNEKTGMR